MFLLSILIKTAIISFILSIGTLIYFAIDFIKFYKEQEKDNESISNCRHVE